MKKITRSIAVLVVLGFAGTTAATAQVTQQKIGDNATLISPNAALEVESTNKGLLLPRLALTATNNVAPLTAHVAGMTVYNTATAGTGTTAVTPGYYYNNGTQWVRLADNSDIKPEPWRIQNTTTDATANTDNIYQQGKVAVGFTNTDAVSGKQFEVKGDIKSVTNNAGTYSVLETNNTDFGTPINVMFTANNPDIMAATTYASVSTFPGQVTLNIQGSNGNSIGIDNEDAQILVENVATGRYNRINIGNNGTEVVDNIMLESSNLSSTIFSKLFVDQNKGVTFKFKPTFGLEGNYTFPKTNGAANQVLVTNGVSPTTGAQLSWADDSDLVDINEPWRIQNTTTEATENTQNIYQMGNVAIQKTTAKTGVTLDIKGTVHGGDNHSVTYLDDDDNEVQAIGNNSAVFGYSNIAQGTASFAAGQYVSALGEGSIAMGSEASARAYASVALGGLAFANGEHSVALGQGKAYGFSSVALGLAQANGYAATAMGNSTNAMGNQSFATGQTNTAASYGETVIGHFNAIITGNATTIVPTDALFQIGNGNIPVLGGRKNAITVLQNGNTAIGVAGTEATAKPTELLDLGGTATAGNGGLKIRNINSAAYTGDIETDKLVVADADGVLKTVDASTIASTEPWQVQGGTTEATANAENIYQTGSVAIGASTIPAITVGATTVNPMLHIAGDVSTTGKYYTTNSVYADYVFEKYFKGTSKLNPGYEFKSLEYVKNFIEENHHLPGVASITDLEKAENGYTFDMTQLTVQSLEKIEELYIHTTEQQDKIDQQQSEIEDMKSRLERLESLLSEKK